MTRSTQVPAPSRELRPTGAAKGRSGAAQKVALARSASWTLLVVYMLAIAAAVMMIFGEASAAQLKLATSSVEAWTAPPVSLPAAGARPSKLKSAS